MALSKIQNSSIADSTLTTAKLATPNLGRRNLIINGAMAVNQRGATSGVTSGYFVDRFTLSGCSASAVITSSTPTQFPTAITVSATSGNPIVTQKIESKNVQHLSGKVVTASFFAKNVSNATTLYASLQYAGSADNWGSSTTISEQNLGTLSSDWVKYTASWTVPSSGLNGLQLNILCAGSSTFTMGVTGVQLEVGEQATPFEMLSYGETLRLCQRYFSHSGDPVNNGFVHSNYLSTHAFANFSFPVPMRTSPTVTMASSGRYYYSVGASKTINSFNSQNISNHNFQHYISGSGWTAGDAGHVDTDSGVRFYEADAEL